MTGILSIIQLVGQLIITNKFVRLHERFFASFTVLHVKLVAKH